MITHTIDLYWISWFSSGISSFKQEQKKAINEFAMQKLSDVKATLME